MFVATVVIGCVILASPGITVDKRTFLRDVCFHIVAVTCLLLLALIQSIYILGPLLLLCVYGVYVWLVFATWVEPEVDQGQTSAAGTVKMQTAYWLPNPTGSSNNHSAGNSNSSRYNRNSGDNDLEMQSFTSTGGYKFITLNEEAADRADREDHREQDQDEDGSVTINFSGAFLGDIDLENQTSGGFSGGSFNPGMLIQDDYFDTKLDNKLRNELITEEKELKESLLPRENNNAGHDSNSSTRSNTRTSTSSRSGLPSSKLPLSLRPAVPVLRNPRGPAPLQHLSRQASQVADYWSDLLQRRRQLHHAGMEFWMSNSLIEQGTIIAQFPGVLLRDLTIPTSDPELWNKKYAMMQPVCAALFTLYVTGIPTGSHLWEMCMLGAGAASLAVFLFSNHNSPPVQPLFALAWVLFGFSMCVMWVYTLAGELVCVLSTIGTIAHIPTALLGLTVLSWGNSIGDLFSNIAVAKQGLAELAVAGCYGGPIFNLLIGLGLSLLLACVAAANKIPAYTFYIPLETTALISFGFLYLTLSSTLISAYLSDYRLTRGLGMYLISVYIVYTIVQLVVLF